MNEPRKPGGGQKPNVAQQNVRFFSTNVLWTDVYIQVERDNVITHLKGAAVFVGENPAKASIDQARECTEIKAENKGNFFGVQAKNKICYIIYTPGVRSPVATQTEMA